ncbi:MAG: DUF721 domain-containing protein [Rickettsiales bacterium]
MKYYGTKNFKDLSASLTKAAFTQHGMSNIKIIQNWPIIVGKELAKLSFPQRIAFKPNQKVDGVLYIAVSNPGFSLSLQAQESLLVEKIATFFGYRAVGRIKIVIDKSLKATGGHTPPTIEKIEANENDRQSISEQIEAIEDEDLQQIFKQMYKNAF